MRIHDLAFRSGVYQITNTTNGRRYIGSSVNLAARIKSHVYRLKNGVGKNRHMQADWDIYGFHSFSARVLVYCSPEHCVAYEQQCFDALQPEYNISPKAGSQLGWSPTPEHAEAHAQRMLRLWSDPSFREMVRAKHRSPVINDDFRLKVSTGLKRHWETQGLERRALIKSRRAAAKLRLPSGSSELKELRSALSTSLWKDPTYKEKAGSALEKMRADPDVQERRKKTLSSHEHQAKLKQNAKSLWSDPAYRAKNCKLSDEQVRLLRSAKIAGAKLKELSGQYGISVSQVSAICTGRQYHWVPMPSE
ncbi:GIY-YIG nuclease family protein [Pseudomonas syringae group genomosp. 3]|uniref:GIY-YIG nuclease family protein n=1 Tax=Pseudomonas syringae group genomosp. 3 TaxID=251701 RepID=UPI0006B9B95D|nr:GIY-YIG nuclease family protein [Pseudomonas syringae group genomosp. 3]